MENINSILLIAQVILSISLISLILIQHGKGAGFLVTDILRSQRNTSVSGLPTRRVPDEGRWHAAIHFPVSCD